jgi:hypothetical protein
MEFTVPQFIEKEAKIVGPFTFKQFLFIGTAGGICMISYFFLPTFVFILVCLILLGGAGALALYKKEGIPLYLVVFKSIFYLFKPKIYLWKKKDLPIRIIKASDAKKREEEKAREEQNKGPQLKIFRSSKLNDLLTQIEKK